MTEDLSVKSTEITPVGIEDEMRKCYLDYAMSVIVSRAIPDVCDGLKPVHRRILWSMHENGYDYNKPFRKSARIVGDVMGKYHPHGDSAIYDAMVRMAQDFSMGVPLIASQGNFGSMDGDKAAAMRYTEARLALSSHWLLEDIDKNTVDFRPNYDESCEEPVVLPARFPNLLVNGSGGIAVGMATNIAPHNLGEVLDACIAMVDNPEITDEELYAIVPAPDFPTGGIILGRGAARSAALTGRGSIIMRGRATIEEIKKDKTAIIITEIPYQVNKAAMITRMAELVKDKTIEGISDLRDESDRHGVRVVVELKRDAQPDVVLNQLYKYTPLQTSFPVNSLALHNGRPEVMNLKDIISAFISFREDVIRRRTIYELDKARNRAHLLVGLAIAVANIDKVIEDYSQINTGFLMFGYLGPQACDIKTSTTIEMLCLILGQGQSSRLYQELIEKAQEPIINVVSADYYHFKDGGNIFIDANFKPEAKDKVIALIKEQINKICEEGITENELKKAKKKLKASFAENSETVSDIAENIGFYMTVCNKLEYVEEYINIIDKITAEDIKNIAQKYINTNYATISILMPESFKN